MNFQKRLEYLNYIIENEIKNSNDLSWRSHLITKKYEYKKINNYFIGDNVLEIGSANHCLTTNILLHWSKKLTTVDQTDSFEEIRKKYSHFKSIICKWEELEIEDEKFSDIVFTHGLEHIENRIEVIFKLKNFLADNGRMHIVVPNALSLHRLIGAEMGLLDSPYDFTEADIRSNHVIVYDFNLLKKDIKAANLNILCMEGIQLKPMTDFQLSSFPREYFDALDSISYLFNEYCSEIYACAIKNYKV